MPYQSLHQYSINGKIGYKNHNVITETSGIKTLRTPVMTTRLSNFRIWVPPGSTAVNLLAHVGQSQSATPFRYGFVARLGRAPASRLPDDITGLNRDGFRLSQISAADCLGQNSAGYVFFARDSGINVTQGAWLYVDFYVLSGNFIDMSSGIQVDVVKFKTWFNAATWLSNGDPPETAGTVTGQVITVSPAQIPFGAVKIGSAVVAKTLTLTSTISTSLVVNVSCPAGFSCSLSVLTLLAKESRAIDVRFSPAEVKAYSGSVRIEAGGNVFLVPVSGSGASAAAPPATELQKLIADLTQKLGTVTQAITSLDQQIQKLAASHACVNNVVFQAVSSVPSAALYASFHMKKVSGSFGSYGISASLSQLQTMKSAMLQEKSFYEGAIGLYNRIDKGLSIPVMGLPPGCAGEPVGSLYHNDNDHPGSRYKMEQGADLHLQNRPSDITQPHGYILPAASTPGDMVCLGGVQFIYTEDGEYYPVGIQEPDNVCTDYDFHHTACDVGGQ